MAQSAMLSHLPTINDVRDAADRIRSFIHRTPIITSQSMNELIGAHLFFKCENFQKVGAFKARGACNAVMRQLLSAVLLLTHQAIMHRH